MSAVVTLTLPAPPSAGPRPYRWTIAEYRELGKTGLFHDKKTMLIHGELYVMVFPNPPHDVSLGLIDDWLRTVFTAAHHIRTQIGFDVGIRNGPEPDVAVVTGSRRDYADRTPTAAVMVVEVAESSLDMDTTTKAELYATAGVPDYWVIDLEHRQLHVFRNPTPIPDGGAAYRDKKTLDPTDAVFPLAAPNAAPNTAVTVADLLP